MTHTSVKEVIELVKAFEDGTLPRSRWTHAALLSVGLYYCLRFEFGTATHLVRDGINRLNRAHGIPNTKTIGYHETMTVFWLITIKQFIETSDLYNLADLANQLIAICDDPRLPLEYYSRELLFSVEAREHHVLPDLDEMFLFVNAAKLTARTGGYSNTQTN